LTPAQIHAYAERHVGRFYWTNGIGVSRLTASQIATWLLSGCGTLHNAGRVVVARDEEDALSIFRRARARAATFDQKHGLTEKEATK
jgi:hypothetical protein